MIRGFVLCCLAAILPLPASPTVIRSGEHADFTRIVVELPQVSPWAIAPHERGYILTAGSLVSKPDLTGVFRYIPRTRLAAVRFDDAARALIFELACDPCHVDAFEIRAGRVVLDFKNGPAPPGNDIEGTERPATPALDGPAASDPPAASTGPAGVRREAPPFAAPILGERRYLPVPAFVQDPTEAAEEVSVGRAVHQDLAQALARAMTQGLIEPGMPVFPETRATGHNTGKPGSTKPDQLRVTTQVDLDRQARNIALPDAGRHTCPPIRQRYPLVRDVSYSDLAPLRARLFNDLDRLRPETALALAAALVSLGLGAEATSVLALLPGDDAQAVYLRAIAGLVDGDPPERPFFGADAACAGPDTIWAFLEMPIAPDLPAERANVLVDQFFQLSSPLRRSIGPRLHDRLLEAQAPEQAMRVARNMAIIDPSRQVAAPLSRARAGDASGQAEALGALIAETGRDSAATLIRFLEAATQEGRQLSRDDLVFVESVIYQFRDEPAGRELVGATLDHAIALRRSDLLMRALEQLASLGPHLPESTLQAIFEALDAASQPFNRLLAASILENWNGDVTMRDQPAMPVSEWLTREGVSATAGTGDRPAADRPIPADPTDAAPSPIAGDGRGLSLEERLARLDQLLPKRVP